MSFYLSLDGAIFLIKNAIVPTFENIKTQKKIFDWKFLIIQNTEYRSFVAGSQSYQTGFPIFAVKLESL